MNKINNKNNIHIHLHGLPQKGQVFFERIINFNKTNGGHVQLCNTITAANLIITTESALPLLESIKNDPVIFVITKNASLGDIQIAPPLLITRVMKTLQNAIQLVDKKPKKIEQVVSTSRQSGLYALVIDDSAAIRKQLELELRAAEIDADFAESGEQAIEKIKKNKFDLIFLDIVMPGIDGYETCKLIRSNEAYKKTPIIMLSGKTSPLDEVQGIIAGATTYLTKPVKSDNLQKVLARVTQWINNFKGETKKKKPLFNDVN